MIPILKTIRAGNVVSLIMRARRVSSGTTNGQLVAVNNFRVSITDPNGVAIVTSALPSEVTQVGESIYRISTSTYVPGNYLITVTADDSSSNRYGPSSGILRVNP